MMFAKLSASAVAMSSSQSKLSLKREPSPKRNHTSAGRMRPSQKTPTSRVVLCSPSCVSEQSALVAPAHPKCGVCGIQQKLSTRCCKWAERAVGHLVSLELPLCRAIIPHFAPPSQSNHQPACHIFHRPEVERE
eukprot:2685721-Pleurochrysis_carterae.AAC.3